MAISASAASADTPPVRLAELVATLSLGIDLGFGQPMEHVLRQCLIALRLSDEIGLDEQTRSDIYYTALLVNVGCHSDAHEQAKMFGDDIAMKSHKYDGDGSARDQLAMLRMIGAGGTPLHRVRTAFAMVKAGPKQADRMIARHAAIARQLGEALDLPDGVLDGLGGSYERWDGKGYPGECGGADIPIASRVAQLAEFVEVGFRADGVAGAITVAQQRAGSQFDPNLVRVLVANSDAIFKGLDDIESWSAVIDAEPSLTRVLSPAECDAALLAIATFVDLKSPYTLGHSRAVAELAADAGRRAGLTDAEVQLVYRAGLVHGFGRLGVSNAIWDKAGRLAAGEWERVRMHPYIGERMLQQSATLAPIARVAVQHMERMDGSGYPKGLSGSAISRPARVLGAAVAYQAMRERRPHRPALTADEAAAQLRADGRAGRLDTDAVEAVLAAAGHRVSARRDGPGGLTAREVEVLRLVAQGLSNRPIAAELVISTKTAGNHVEHIYSKLGVNSRPAAALFAMQNGLLPEETFVF